MNIVVQKYGGTSVGSIERIQSVARRICAEAERGFSLIVVVSAMGHTTDELLDLAAKVNPRPGPRESDMLVTTGEQVSAALLTMSIQSLGFHAISLTGWQAGIETNRDYSRARIVRVQPDRILRELGNGNIVVVAGFQGINPDGDITTLGRGGSDTSAVALAAAVGAEVCEIFTDVDGVYTTDPRIVPEARKLAAIDYCEMMEMANLGAQVLQVRSVELAREHRVIIHVRSSFSEEPGTIVKEVQNMENLKPVTGVTYDPNVAKIAVINVLDKPGIAYRLFSALAERKVNVDMIIQSVNRDGVNDISFTVSRGDLEIALETVRAVLPSLGGSGIVHDAGVCKVSIVGVGMSSTAGVAATMFEALASAGINIEMISTSEIRISCVIQAEDGEKAVKAIHRAFKLDEP